jgi:hypothetical protein
MVHFVVPTVGLWFVRSKTMMTTMTKMRIKCGKIILMVTFSCLLVVRGLCVEASVGKHGGKVVITIQYDTVPYCTNQNNDVTRCTNGTITKGIFLKISTFWYRSLKMYRFRKKY